jgi:nucleoside phosphorylase
VRVVLGLTGIGMLNAAGTAAAVFARFDVAGAVFSGVAGGPRIGDVTVPTQWRVQDTGAAFDVNPALFALARRVRRLDLEQCTIRPSTGETICVEHEPRIVLGGVGVSGDPFGGMPLPCDPAGGEVFGCDVTPAAKRQDPVAEDMETAAVAQMATERQIPFVGFRGASDGAGDPLNLPGFPVQFFAWYRLAADNAAAATVAALERLARLGDGRRGHERVCRLLADARWKQAARRLR